jgi:hypothetical protein
VAFVLVVGHQRSEFPQGLPFWDENEGRRGGGGDADNKEKQVENCSKETQEHDIRRFHYLCT